MIIIDEYLAVRVVLGDWPAGMPDDDVALPTMGTGGCSQRCTTPGRSAHWRPRCHL